MPIKYPHLAGTKYRPSNGTESLLFEEDWCNKCSKFNKCGIWLDAWAYEVDESQYPREWIFDDDGVPKCTVFAAKT